MAKKRDFSGIGTSILTKNDKPSSLSEMIGIDNNKESGCRIASSKNIFILLNNVSLHQTNKIMPFILIKTIKQEMLRNCFLN